MSDNKITKEEILRKFDEAIQFFINCSENLPGTDFCNNVDKLIDVKCDIANGVDESSDQALHKHIVSGSTLHKVGTVLNTDTTDCCGLCRYNRKCPNEVYEKCLDELKDGEYYR